MSSAWQKCADDIVAAVKSYVSRQVGPLVIRADAQARRQESTDALLADLEQRLSALEQRNDDRR